MLKAYTLYSNYINQENESGGEVNMATIKDYIYCEDCETFVDFWKYGDIKDTGHDECKWRYVTKEELKGCIEDCKKDGCFDECILGVKNPSDRVQQ